MADQPGAAEDAQQGVVILRGDGVELVVVAAGAGHRGRLERLGERVDLVVRHVEADLGEVDAVVVGDLAEPIEGRADHRLVDPFRGVQARLRQQVAGDLLAHELVVGHVVR